MPPIQHRWTYITYDIPRNQSGATYQLDRDWAAPGVDVFVYQREPRRWEVRLVNRRTGISYIALDKTTNEVSLSSLPTAKSLAEFAAKDPESLKMVGITYTPGK